MKTYLIFIFILTPFHLFAQENYKSPVIGLDYNVSKDFSIKGGFVQLFEFSKKDAVYYQLYSKYNFTNKSIGGQAAIGYSTFDRYPKLIPLGGRFGIDHEYSFEFEKNEVSLFLLAGIDAGFFSLVIGPKLNLTKNIDQSNVGFNITLDLFIPTENFVEKVIFNKIFDRR